MLPDGVRARKAEALVFAAAVLAFIRSASFGYIQDDFGVLVNNPLLDNWRHLDELLLSGYWQPSSGSSTPVSIYRPLVSLSYFLQVQTLDHPGAFHVLNVLLHGCVAVTVLSLVRRWLKPETALVAALLFAVHPIQCEAVVRVASRPDLLCALFLLTAWGLLEDKKLLAGAGAYALALGSLECAVVFPAVYAAFVHWRRGPDGSRREFKTVIALGLLVVGYLGLRSALLEGPLIRGGTPYFGGVSAWVKFLTLARFWAECYLWPLVSGLGIFLDPMRPFFPDASPKDPIAIALLFGWIALAGGSVWAAFQRRAWGFWALFAAFFLLPTSHLLFRYDTLGAERFLYLPSIAFFVLAASALEKIRTPLVAAALILWFAGRTLAIEGAWKDQRTFWTAVLVQCPNSGPAHNSLGVVMAQEGDLAGAEKNFKRVIALTPGHAEGYYNLAKLRFETGKLDEAAALSELARTAHPKEPENLILLALIAERRGRLELAEKLYEEAIAVKPWDPLARFNLGRLCLLRGDHAAASRHWTVFLSYAPADEAAPEVRRLLGAH